VNAWDRVGAVTVAFNSASVIGACLESIRPAKRVVVVDNASTDDSVAVAMRALPTAEIVRAGGNIGFGRGNNLGIERLDTEFALLINPDAVMQPGSVEALVAAADRFPHAALLGPVLMGPDGAIHQSHNLDFFRRVAAGSWRNPIRPEGDISVGHLSGAVLLARAAAIKALGGFDPAIFLFYEDDDLCLRLKAAGHELVRVADAVALHQGGKSSGTGQRVSWIKFRAMGWSRLHIERKHRGSAALARTASWLMTRHAARAAGNLLLGRWQKTRQHAAWLAGMAAFLSGRPSIDSAQGRG